jgi:hypothetical protein
VIADGVWSDSFEQLILAYCDAHELPLEPVIDQQLWDTVVGRTRLDATGAPSAEPGDPPAVYLPPWEYSTAVDAVANEVDLMQCVVYPEIIGDVASVYAEPSTVDILIHHRDTVPLLANDAFAILMYKNAQDAASLLGEDLTPVHDYARQRLAAARGSGGVVLPPPDGWHAAGVAPPDVDRLSVSLDARMPRAISIDVDLSHVLDPVAGRAVNPGQRMLFVAFVGSRSDAGAFRPDLGGLTVPAGRHRDVGIVIPALPYAAARLVRVWNRPSAAGP